MSTAASSAVATVRRAARPLPGSAGDFDPLLDLVANARFALIGAASHGTHEFYRERARLTQRLIQDHGFNAVAVEGDWPDSAEVRSNTFTMEWPPGSGRMRSFPEVDRGGFFPVAAARVKLKEAQVAFVERLLERLGGGSGRAEGGGGDGHARPRRPGTSFESRADPPIPTALRCAGAPRRTPIPTAVSCRGS